MDNEKSLKEVEKVLTKGSKFTIKSIEEFNKSIDHVIQLIMDSYTLYKIKSFSTSVFISIAVIEEVGKIHMGIYINNVVETKKDSLRDHKTKEIIGSNYTICMGERLQKAIGKEKIEEIYRLSYDGTLKDLREKALYCDREEDDFVTPSECISEDFSKNILLFAIESFDDNLVGYSEYSIGKSKSMDEIFIEISKKDKKSVNLNL